MKLGWVILEWGWIEGKICLPCLFSMREPHLSYLLICGITIIFIYFCNAGRRPPSSSILILCITISSAQFRAFNATSRFCQGSENLNSRKCRIIENFDPPKIIRIFGPLPCERLRLVQSMVRPNNLWWNISRVAPLMKLFALIQLLVVRPFDSTQWLFFCHLKNVCSGARELLVALKSNKPFWIKLLTNFSCFSESRRKSSTTDSSHSIKYREMNSIIRLWTDPSSAFRFSRSVFFVI